VAEKSVIILFMTNSLTPLSSLAKRLHPHLRGQLAEKLALVSYMAAGWRPLRQMPQNLAQTDLTLIRGHTILLVEVKYRSSRGRGHVAVTSAQRQRLNRQMIAVSGRYPQHSVGMDIFLVFPQWPFTQRIRNPYADEHGS